MIPSRFRLSSVATIGRPDVFPITTPAGQYHVSRNMQSQADPVHTLKVLDRNTVQFQWDRAVTAVTPKHRFHSVGVCRIRYAQVKRSNYLATQFVKEHADQLVGDVRLRSSTSLTQARRCRKTHGRLLLARASLVRLGRLSTSAPNNQLALTFKTAAMPFTS